MAVSAIRKWWNTYRLDKSDTDSSTIEEHNGLAERSRLCTKLHQTLRTKQLDIDFDGGRPIVKLTAPRDLVNISSVCRPRWPVEVEFINDDVKHTEWDPPEPEPFYQPNGHEERPMPCGEQRGRVVYSSQHATEQPYFTCSHERGNSGTIGSTITSCDTDQSNPTLEFESRFESGNLKKAVQVDVYEYELTLRTDLYTKKHTQWFYFRLRNMEAGVTYRFTIVNLMKKSSLYSLGMKPLLYSERKAREEGAGWQRTGSDITYYRNCTQDTKDDDESSALYSLTWTLQFPYDSDTCYLAHCYPYTYSHLQHYLQRVSSNPAVASFCKLRVLCRSLAGNQVYMLTITSQGSGKDNDLTKKAVVVTARVHPGETNSSWMMEGLLDFLLGDSADAKLIRDTFVFKVVPMLNPDGVVVGNYRCSLTGRDLNRNYKTMLRDSFPSVWNIRKMVQRLMAETDVVLYCDFHGHNRKNNVFMYGCNNQSKAAEKLHDKVFPLMMSKNASNKFSFKSCKFKVQRCKEGTGRVAMWRLGVRNSYTMESTFGGSTLGDRRGTHFTTRDLKSLGVCFCDTLLDFCDPDPTKVNYCLTELTVLLRKKVRDRYGKDMSTDSTISVSDLESSTSGSDSSDSDELPAHLLHSEQTPVKKHLKSRKERNKLRSVRVKNASQKSVTLSSVDNDTAVDTAVSSQKSVRKHRRKWQENSGTKKEVIAPLEDSQPTETSQVWQGFQRVKDISLEDKKVMHSKPRVATTPHRSKCARQSSPKEELRVNRCQWRCSSQLLHLSALLPSTDLPYPSQRQYYPQPSFISYTGRSAGALQQHTAPRMTGLLPSITASQRSRSSYVKTVPDAIPIKRLLSSYGTYRDRSSLGSPEQYYGPEYFSTSQAHLSARKWQSEEQEEEASGLGLPTWTCKPFAEMNQRDLMSNVPQRKRLSHTTLFASLQKAIESKKTVSSDSGGQKPFGYNL